MKAIVIFSGGMDSTVLAYHLKSLGHELILLGVNYGQRHAKELEAARAIAQRIGVHFEIADLSAIRTFLAGSSQTSDGLAVPEGHYAEESMKLTVVPNRNAIMLNVALGWAISLKFDAVYYGAHGGDHAIYPDCRPEFVRAMCDLASVCDWHKVAIEAPFIHTTKAGIAKLGKSLGVPFEITWSCYKGGKEHCGKCGTCVERKEAFELAGFSDPTKYE